MGDQGTSTILPEGSVPIVLVDHYEAGKLSPNVPEVIAEMFPDRGPLHVCMWWATQESDCPAIFQLAALLPAWLDDMARRGWRIGPERLVPKIWIGLVGEPSARKSQAIAASQALYRLHRVRRLRDEYVDPYHATEGTPQGLLGGLMARYDAAANATFAILADNELSTILEHKEKANEYMINMRDGVTIERHTLALQKEKRETGKAADVLRNPIISAIFASTPSSLQRVLRSHHVEGGLFSRMTWIWGELAGPDKEPWRNIREEQLYAALTELDEWAAAMDGFELVLEQQRQIAQDQEFDEAIREGRQPRMLAPAKVVHMPDEVKNYYLEHWFRPWEQKVGGHGRLEASVNRGGEMVRTLAGFFAWTRCSNVMSVDDMQCAIAFVEYAMGSAKQLDRLISGDNVYQLSRKAQEALRRVGWRGMRRDELYEELKCSPRDFKAVLEELEEQELMRVDIRVKEGQKGRPPKIYKPSNKLMGVSESAEVIPIAALNEK